MIRTAIATCLLLGTAATATPRDAATTTPRDDVMAAVDAALQAVNTNDAALFTKVMVPQAIIVAQNYAADGSLASTVLTVAEMAERLSTPGRRIDERLQKPVVLIQHDIAHVWSPYTLDKDGKRLHCGIDSFGLARIDNAWRVTSLTWTAEPRGCPE